MLIGFSFCSAILSSSLDGLTIRKGENNQENDTENETTDAAVLAQAKLSKDQAISALQTQIGDTVSTVVSVDLENENSRAVYSVIVADKAGNQSEYKVDAVTGSVTSEQADDQEDGMENDSKNTNTRIETNEGSEIAD